MSENKTTKRDTSFTSYKNSLKREKEGFNVFAKLKLEKPKKVDSTQVNRIEVDNTEEEISIKPEEVVIEERMQESVIPPQNEQEFERVIDIEAEDIDEQSESSSKDQMDNESEKIENQNTYKEEKKESFNGDRDTSFKGYKEVKSERKKKVAREYITKINEIGKILLIVIGLMIIIPFAAWVTICLYGVTLGLLVGGIVMLGVAAFFWVTEMLVMSQMILFLAMGLLSGGGLSVIVSILVTRKEIELFKWSRDYIAKEGGKVE